MYLFLELCCERYETQTLHCSYAIFLPINVDATFMCKEYITHMWQKRTHLLKHQDGKQPLHQQGHQEIGFRWQQLSELSRLISASNSCSKWLPPERPAINQLMTVAFSSGLGKDSRRDPPYSGSVQQPSQPDMAPGQINKSQTATQRINRYSARVLYKP